MNKTYSCPDHYCHSFHRVDLYTGMIVPTSPYRRTEAAHALRGLLIADDLRQGSWLGFLLDTYGRGLWPPLHSSLTGPGFPDWPGPGMVTAHTCSLVTYLLTVPLLYLAAQSMRKTGREVVQPAVPVILFLTSHRSSILPHSAY